MTAPVDRAGLVRVMADAFFASRHRGVEKAMDDAFAAMLAASPFAPPQQGDGT